MREYGAVDVKDSPELESSLNLINCGPCLVTRARRGLLQSPLLLLPTLSGWVTNRRLEVFSNTENGKTRRSIGNMHDGSRHKLYNGAQRLPAGPQLKRMGIGDTFQLAYFLDFISRVKFSQLITMK